MDEELLRGELSIVRQALAVIALFSLLGSTVQALSTENATTFDTVTTFLDPVLYAALWFWAKKRPYAAAVCGAVLFGVSQLSLILLQPAALAQGIVVKVIVISMLYRGIRAAARYRDFLRENGRG